MWNRLCIPCVTQVPKSNADTNLARDIPSCESNDTKINGYCFAVVSLIAKYVYIIFRHVRFVQYGENR